MRIYKTVLVLSVLLPASAGRMPSAAAEAVRQAAPANDSITKAALKADLYFLASDDLQGRLTNTPGDRIAADWIASRFERMGLAPEGPNGSYFQPFDLMVETLGSVERNQLKVDRSNQTGTSGVVGAAARFGGDFYPARFSASDVAVGDLVFAGFGITSRDRQYDDYTGGAARGKIVLVLDHEPGERDPASAFDGVVAAEASSPLRKAQFAQDAGALGVLFVADVHNHPGAQSAPAAQSGPPTFETSASTYWPATPPRIDRFTLAAWVDRIKIPAMQISPEFADALVRDSGKSLLQLAQSAETDHGMTPVGIPGVRVTMSAAVDRHRIADRNVVGVIAGSDPRLKDEAVVVCAHYDHEGADGPRIFNGADDDGSGIVALIEIAEAYAKAALEGHRPRRTVLFGAWDSEERGLLGAWAYTESPTRPLDQIAAVLNMDMLGRNEEVPPEGGPRFRGLVAQTAESNANAVNIIGTSRSADMKSAADRANGGIGLELKYRYDNNVSQLMRRSDHWPFLQRGVPGVWFHTGLHPDYHTPGDRPERINYAKMEKIARMVHQMSWDLANANSRPKLMGRATHEM
jgi:Peptidase family M28/PA domain